MRVTFNIKKRYIVLLILAACIYYYMYLLAWLNPGRAGYYESSGIVTAIENAMGLPDWYDDSLPSDLVKKLSILNLTKEEWDEISCKKSIDPDNIMFNNACVYDEKGFAPGKWNNKPCPPLYLPLKTCVQPLIWFGGRKASLWPFDDVPDYAAEYCSVFTRTNCIVIDVSEYVLKKPEILDVIIKAAEQPCKFIPVEHQHSNYEETLSCFDREDKKPETIIINFYDQNRKDRFHIVTKRKE